MNYLLKISESGAFHVKDEPSTMRGGSVRLWTYFHPRGNLSFYQLSREVTTYPNCINQRELVCFVVLSVCASFFPAEIPTRCVCLCVRACTAALQEISQIFLTKYL